jgi:hypothetical protein
MNGHSALIQPGHGGLPSEPPRESEAVESQDARQSDHSYFDHNLSRPWQNGHERPESLGNELADYVFRHALLVTNKRKSNRKVIHQRSCTYDEKLHGTLDGLIAVDVPFLREDTRMTDEADLERMASQVTKRGRASRTMSSIDSHGKPRRLQDLLIQALVKGLSPLPRSFIPKHILLQMVLAYVALQGHVGPALRFWSSARASSLIQMNDR